MRISTQELVRAALFTALMCALTVFIRLIQPIAVIPFSLQPLVVALAAYLLSPRAVFLSMLAYLFLGIFGLPVFSVPPYGGPAYILVPSFGFILAFPFAGWLTANVIRKRNIANFILAGIAGMMVYYLIGLPYMYLILDFYVGQTVNIVKLIKIGFLPFVVFDLLKVVFASYFALELSKRLEPERNFKH